MTKRTGLSCLALCTFSISLAVALGPSPVSPPGIFAEDGAWCWFSDPRAVFHHGPQDQSFIGWVDSRGNIVVGAFNHAKGSLQTKVIHKRLEVDDHANPSLLLRPDGTLLAFYSRHADSSLRLRRTKHPLDISEWEREQKLVLNDPASHQPGLRDRYCYTNPCQLTAEGNRVYLFWRGLANKPNISYSDDGGRTWAKGRILVQARGGYRDQRPYLKASSNGADRIHLAFTDGHPRDEPTNSIYYALYRDHAFFRADGTRIAGFGDIPFDPRESDVVYDGRLTGVQAWVWDITQDSRGYPVIVYARLPAENDHRYHYARFDGKRWQDSEIAVAGGWFPETPHNEEQREPHYSGGIVLDHAEPSRAFLSRRVNGVFEIESWTTDDLGGTWRSNPVTSGSGLDNVRPFVVRNAPPWIKPRVVWMRNRQYLHYTDYDTSIVFTESAPTSEAAR